MGRIKDEAFFQMVHDYLKIYLPNQMCQQQYGQGISQHSA